MKKLIPVCIFVCLFFSCTGKNEPKKPAVENLTASGLSGMELAKIHCAQCHAFTPPSDLSKIIWEADILPAMGNRLGIYNGRKQPDSIFGSPENRAIIKDANIFPEEPLLARADWMKLVDYYLENALDSFPIRQRSHEIEIGLKHFEYKEVSFTHRPPLTTMVKILEQNKGIVFSDSKPNNTVLTFIDPNLDLKKNITLNNTPIHYYENSDTVYLTTIGKNIFPNDLSNGMVQKILPNALAQNQIGSTPILNKLQRPVAMAYGDLNNDGKDDIIACEYGNLTGKLVWYENQGSNKYVAKELRNKPGAITAIIKDYNKDGLNDIFVLMAQGQEGVFYYENNGDSTFSEKSLLTFSPLNGSQYIELADFNNDGFDDILYVCGDNADKTPILKDYHGIYIFLNDRNLNFTQAYFYQQNGAYKAIPRDYDLDGDLDIASISFFPDYVQYPEESFVYLENKGNLTFEASSFPQSTKGRWIVMDVGDVDGDGDVDIALGSFVYFLAKGDTTGLSKKWLTESPSVIVLENTIK
jgi:hypothetical protein